MPRTWAGFVLLLLGVLVLLLVAPFIFAYEAARETWTADVLPAWRELRDRASRAS